ncbi:hypothetical protein F4809DRAFT_650161 [Biscogniauxia mediterranea]|nr:hypothetical protein F4809DRAFT_650161 [Biscogniauxia mediterranea]
MAAVTPETAVAINRKKARYARYADTKQWDKFEEEVALPDAQYDYQDVEGKTIDLGTPCKFASTKHFTAFFRPFFARLQTLHNVGPGDFTQTADDEVEAVFAFEDQLLAPPLGSWAELRGGGFYYETWKRVDGDWFLQHLRMQRTYQKTTFLVGLAIFLQRKLGITLL